MIPTVPPAQATCFQVQFLARLPALEAKQFVQQVAALGNADDASSPPPIAVLRQQAQALRVTEGQDYSRLSSLLTRLGAPASLQTWAASEATRLSRPVVLSPEEQKDAKTDPDTGEILATMNEATDIKSDTDDHMSDIGTWISLTYHQPGLWAADVGELTAALHVAVAHQVPPRLAGQLAAHLQMSAPIGTPQAVTHALGLLIPPAAGNLSGLVPTVNPVSLATASHVSDTLMTAFAAPSLKSG